MSVEQFASDTQAPPLTINHWRIGPEERADLMSAEGVARGDVAQSIVDRLRDEGAELSLGAAAELLDSVREAKETVSAYRKQNDPPPIDEGAWQGAQSKAKPNGPDAPQSEPQSDVMPRRLSLSELARREPQPPRFNMPGLLPTGEVTLFAGDGGTGKSAIGLMAAVCSSAGRPFYGIPTERRKAGFVSLEDSEEILHWRLKRTTQWLGIDLASLDDWLIAYDASKADGLMLADSRDGPYLTAAYEWLRAEIQAHGLQFIVIDSASDAYGASENERRAVRMFIRALRRLIPPDGALLLLAHVDKLSARNPDTATGYSGSTAWSNSARSRWYLRADNDALLLEVQKSNYAPKGSALRLEWNDSAHLFVGEMEMPTSKLDRELADSDEREAVLGLIRTAQQNGNPVPAASAGSRTSWHVLAAMPGFPKSMTGKAGRARLFAVLETLQAARVLTRTTEKYGKRNSREVLHACGISACA